MGLYGGSGSGGSLFGGSSGGGGLYGGGAGGASAPGSAAPVHKPRRWFGALLDNLEEFGRGIGPGLLHIGESAYNDADKLTGDRLPFRHSKSFMLDDVAKAVGQDYKTRYSKDIWNQLAEHPLDFILDAATLLTLGGASFATIPAKLVVKGGVKGALRAGSLSEKVTRWAGYVPRTPEAVAAAERVYGKASKQVRQGADQGIVQGVRRVGEGRGGELELRQHQNPVLRLRDRGVDKVLGSPALDEVPLVGLEARAARKERRSPAIKADVNRERLVAASTKAFGKLSRDEKAAWWFLHEKASPQEFAAMLKQRRDGGGLSEHEIGRAHV